LIQKSRIPKNSYLLADIFVIAIFSVITVSFGLFLQVGSAPYIEAIEIDTSLWALPGYLILSLTRSFVALSLSYMFAIVYGSLAAKSKAHERILIPLVDVLQSLPVLTFLPGFIIALTAVFPSSRWGLEISCILMLFTGQVWNLVFAYYESQKKLASELKEFAKLSQFKATESFLFLDLPNATRPLIFNGMMSMSGGWFFLTLCEAFVLGEKNYRLPGIGSFLGASFETQNMLAFWVGILVLILAILGIDFLLWKPLITWCAQNSDDTNSAHEPKSYIYQLWLKARLHIVLKDRMREIFENIRLKIKNRELLKKTSQNNKIGVFSDTLALVIRPNTWFESKKIKNRFLISLMSQWTGSVLVGLGVFWLLPKLPEVALFVSQLKSKDWIDLIHALFMTGIRVFGVLFIATLWAVPFSLWVGKNPKVRSFMLPIIQNIASFPAPVLYPILALTLYRWNVHSSIIALFLMTIGNQWYLVFNLLTGTTQISEELKNVCRVYRTSPWQRFRFLYFPTIFPNLVTGWITAAGGAWNASIVAEIITFPGGKVQSTGIGAEITQATATGNYAKLMAAILVIAVALIIINRTLWRSLSEYAENMK
jgi:NitT/TauT family transport system permease protein